MTMRGQRQRSVWTTLGMLWVCTLMECTGMYAICRLEDYCRLKFKRHRRHCHIQTHQTHRIYTWDYKNMVKLLLEFISTCHKNILDNINSLFAAQFLWKIIKQDVKKRMFEKYSIGSHQNNVHVIYDHIRLRAHCICIETNIYIYEREREQMVWFARIVFIRVWTHDRQNKQPDTFARHCLLTHMHVFVIVYCLFVYACTAQRSAHIQTHLYVYILS